MSNGHSFGGSVVHSEHLQLPSPNPLPCDPNYEVPLAQCVPYVVDYSVQKLQIKAQVFTQSTQTLCDYVITLASFDESQKLVAVADASTSGNGVSISTAWNAETKQNTVTLEVDITRIPDNILYMMGGIVSGRGFSQWPGNRMDIEVRGVTSGNPYQGYRSSEAVSRTLGRRELQNLTGTAYGFIALVRAGAWWHLYPLRANTPGATSIKELRTLWELEAALQGQEMQHFIRSCKWGAHAPERRRVVLHVNSGHDLAVKDPSLFKKLKGTSDPYCKVFCGPFEETYEVKKKTLNPKWSYDDGPPQALRAVAASDARVFLVHVFDRDNNKSDDFMGCCYVPVAHAFTLPLGEHYLNVKLVPMDPGELARIREQYGVAEWKRHQSTNVRGYLTIEVRTELEQDATLYL